MNLAICFAIGGTIGARANSIVSGYRDLATSPQLCGERPKRTAILGAYRQSMGNPQAGPMFINEDGDLLDLDKLGTRLVRPAIRTIGVTWHGWHAFRRGIASNLFSMGVNEKIVQRILRQSKAHVTKERYIEAFDPDVIAAMRKMEETIYELRSLRETNKRQ